MSSNLITKESKINANSFTDLWAFFCNDGPGQSRSRRPSLRLETGLMAQALLQFDFPDFHDALPFRDLALDEAAHLLGAARARRAAPLGKPLADVRKRHDAPDLAVEPLDDRGRQSRRTCYSEERSRLVAGHALRDSGHVRQHGGALERGDRERPEFARLDLQIGIGERIEQQFHAAR